MTAVKVRDHGTLQLGCKSDTGRSRRGLNRRSRKDAVVASDRRPFPRQNRGSRFACFDFVVVTMLVRTSRLKHGGIGRAASNRGTVAGFSP